MTDLCAECGGGFTAAEWELRHSRTDGEDIHDHCCDCGGDHMTRYEPTPDEIHETTRVYMLHGWRNSGGATAEWYTAHVVGLKVIYQDAGVV